MTTGMEGLAAGASALQGQSAGLRAAVDNGQLVMDPERAKAVAAVYDEKADKLARKTARVDQYIAHGAYGRSFIGDQLAAKFEQKVNAKEVGLVPILVKMEQTLRDMAQAYRDSARDMQNTDDENARNLPKV